MLNNLDDINLLLSLGAAIFLYFVGLGYAITNKNPGTTFALKIFSIAFILRVAAVLLIYYSLLAFGGDGYVISDDRAYNHAGLDIARDLDRGKPGFKEYGSGYVNIAYFNLNGFLYYYFNFDTLTMRVLNSFFGAITVLLAYYVMQCLFNEKVARLAAVFTALLPNLIFWSASQVKDPLILLCTMSLTYIMVCKFRSGINLLVVLAYCFFMYLLWNLRKDFCFPLIAISIVWGVLHYTSLGAYFNNPFRAMSVKMIFLGLISAPILIGLVATRSGGEFVETMEKFNEVQEKYAESGGSSGSAGFSRYLRVVSPLDFYKLPPAMAFTAIAPLPSFGAPKRIRAYGSVLYSYINIPLVLLMPFVVVGFFNFKSSNIKFSDELLLRWLPILTWASISIIYMGVARYKAVLLPYFAMWAAVGWYYRFAYRSYIVVAYAAVIAGVGIMISIAMMFR